MIVGAWISHREDVYKRQQLGIVLTSREIGSGNKMPMCGVPHHAVDEYIATLVKNGHKVAIADQVEDPRTARGLVRRDLSLIHI